MAAVYTHRGMASGWMRLRNSCFGTGDFEGGKATKVRVWTPFPGTLADFRQTRRSSRYDELRRSDWLWTRVRKPAGGRLVQTIAPHGMFETNRQAVFLGRKRG